MTGGGTIVFGFFNENIDQTLLLAQPLDRYQLGLAIAMSVPATYSGHSSAPSGWVSQEQ